MCVGLCVKGIGGNTVELMAFNIPPAVYLYRGIIVWKVWQIQFIFCMQFYGTRFFFYSKTIKLAAFSSMCVNVISIMQMNVQWVLMFLHMVFLTHPLRDAVRASSHHRNAVRMSFCMRVFGAFFFMQSSAFCTLLHFFSTFLIRMCVPVHLLHSYVCFSCVPVRSSGFSCVPLCF